jgi:Rieske 2Fe-2S family protein
MAGPALAFPNDFRQRNEVRRVTTFVRASVGAGASTLEGRWYASGEVFERERERVFARDWVCVGRLEELASEGDYVLAEVAGESLIVVRERDRKVRAFYNVCRHRGTRMCEDAAGHFTGSIQCPYHAWTYGLDGSLRVARNMSDVPGFDASLYALRETALATWEGFILVSLAAQPQPFAEAFAPLVDRFANWNVAGLRTAVAIDYEVRANWKLIVQNYSECYHCPLVHPQLEKLSPSDSGRNDLDKGPFLGGYSELREAASLTTSGQRSRAPVGRVAGDDLARVYYYTIFPSMLLSLHPDYVMVHYLQPLGPNQTNVRCAWLFDSNAMKEPDFDASDAVEFWDATNRQDWHVNELTQAGVESRSYVPGPYSNAEGLLAAFDRYYLGRMT